MMEVTDEMKQALTNIQHGYQLISCEGGVKLVFSNSFLEKALTRIIELHEANRPKPEPVGYIYPSSYEKALRNESSCKMFVVPVTNLDTDEESSVHLYTTPPTREPLSEDEIRRLWKNGTNVETIVEFARLIEQAHGIGVTND